MKQSPNQKVSSNFDSIFPHGSHEKKAKQAQAWGHVPTFIYIAMNTCPTVVSISLILQLIAIDSLSGRSSI